PSTLTNIKYSHLKADFYVDHNNFHFDILNDLIDETDGDTELSVSWYHRTENLDISIVKQWLLTFSKSRSLSLKFKKLGRSWKPGRPSFDNSLMCNFTLDNSILKHLTSQISHRLDLSTMPGDYSIEAVERVYGEFQTSNQQEIKILMPFRTANQHKFFIHANPRCRLDIEHVCSRERFSILAMTKS
ncbi:hypothetical protein PFISCL1PPCAC_11796, partial [Pristionchus fissidentatus]